jgi:hypothetical protein
MRRRWRRAVAVWGLAVRSRKAGGRGCAFIMVGRGESLDGAGGVDGRRTRRVHGACFLGGRTSDDLMGKKDWAGGI